MARKATQKPAPVEEFEDDADADGGVDVIELDGNLDDVEKPEDIKAGRYLSEIVGVEVKQGPKARYYNIVFVIPPEEYPSDQREGLEDSNPDGIQMYYNRVMVPRSAADRRTIHRVRKFMEVLGLPTATNKIDPNDWMGQKAILQIKMGKWQGEVRPEIGSVLKADRGAPASARR